MLESILTPNKNGPTLKLRWCLEGLNECGCSNLAHQNEILEMAFSGGSG